VTGDETPGARPARGWSGMFFVAFALVFLSALVLAVSGLTRSLSSGLSWLSIALSVVAAVVAVLSLRAHRG
jgi:membrane protein YdbS with pleckstrin-like domain